MAAAQFPISVPTPTSTSTCLNLPPAPTMSRMPAIPGSAPPTESDRLVRSIRRGAEQHHAEHDAGEQRDRRVADDVEQAPHGVAGRQRDLRDRPQEHEDDG